MKLLKQIQLSLLRSFVRQKVNEQKTEKRSFSNLVTKDGNFLDINRLRISFSCSHLVVS